jgi:Type IV secretion system pilin
MKKYINISITTLLLLPTVAFAQLTGVKDLINAVGGLINPLIVVLLGAALVVFIWGLVKFIFRIGGDEKAVEAGKKLMLWGLIALFVMISVWGIIGFMQKALSLPASNPPILIPT